MALKESIKKMNDLMTTMCKDLSKVAKGNKAAAQRVRTLSIRFAKVAKEFRKQSIKGVKKTTAKKTTKRKTTKRKAAPKRKTTKRKVAKKTTTKRKAPAKRKTAKRKTTRKAAPKRKATKRRRK